MKIRSILILAMLVAAVAAVAALAASPPTTGGTTRIALGDSLSVTTTDTGTSYNCGAAWNVYNGITFVWKAPATQAVEADTFGSNFDTVLAVVDRSKGTNTVLGCVDDSSGTVQSRVDFGATKGHTYYLVAGGYGGAIGSLVMHLAAT